MSRLLRVGDPMPDFTLYAHDGRQVRGSELLSKGALVVYFYPRDNTLGCTAEARGFRNRHDELAALGATVVGISSDTIDCHKAFREEHQLPFPLLADTDDVVRRAFGVPRTLGILPGRATFVVDPEGMVRHVVVSQLQPRRHIEEAVAALRRMA